MRERKRRSPDTGFDSLVSANPLKKIKLILGGDEVVLPFVPLSPAASPSPRQLLTPTPPLIDVQEHPLVLKQPKEEQKKIVKEEVYEPNPFLSIEALEKDPCWQFYSGMILEQIELKKIDITESFLKANQLNFSYANVHFTANMFYTPFHSWMPEPNYFINNYKMPSTLCKIVITEEDNKNAVLTVMFDFNDFRFVELYDVKKGKKLSGTQVVDLFKQIIVPHLKCSMVYLQDAARIEEKNALILTRMSSLIESGMTSYEKQLPGLKPLDVQKAPGAWYADTILKKDKCHITQSSSVFFNAKKHFMTYDLEVLLKYHEKSAVKKELVDFMNQHQLKTTDLLSTLMKKIRWLRSDSSSLSSEEKAGLNKFVDRLFTMTQFYNDIGYLEDPTQTMKTRLCNNERNSSNAFANDLFALARTRYYAWEPATKITPAKP